MSFKIATLQLLLGGFLVSSVSGGAISNVINDRRAPYIHSYCDILYLLETRFHDFKTYAPDLACFANADNKICWARVTGLWIYYENANYNRDAPGMVFWVHGVEYETKFPAAFCKVASSLRFAGNHYRMNEDSWTIYDKPYFVGEDLYGRRDASYLWGLHYNAESIITTGKSSWTLSFDVNGYLIKCCLAPNIVDRSRKTGRKLHFGVYPEIKGSYANSLVGIEKGCRPFVPICSKSKIKRDANNTPSSDTPNNTPNNDTPNNDKPNNTPNKDTPSNDKASKDKPCTEKPASEEANGGCGIKTL